MKNKISGYKLQRNASARKALLRGLVTSVIVEERITTTVTKAKAAAPLVDNMITLAKRKGPSGYATRIPGTRKLHAAGAPFCASSLKERRSGCTS